MQQLDTIQKREKLNNVFNLDVKESSGAHHSYKIQSIDNDKNGYPLVSHALYFQKGARHLEESVHGVLDQDLLEIVRDRLKGFQSGPYSCRENELALTHIEEALMWLNMRVEDRISRNVLGCNIK